MNFENENVIEWITGQKTVSVTFNQQKYITKIKKLAEKYPDKIDIIRENEDGTLFAHIPLKAIKINITERNIEYTEEQKEVLRERMRKIHAEKIKKKVNGVNEGN